ncbi:hypothetical protein NQ314_004822 [Rhamnusium bicolor]|uniref:Fibronectin type-III domain-containing protein n=1 Tax=Rhamnusium bicolor TaxID=1586634 RepID=A0AAV8ZIG4_9CUCU|nr:hypothetical protein NQ314_004822 [Rhamnusium bicolor]
MWSLCLVLCFTLFSIGCNADRELIPLDAPENLTLIDFDDRDVIIEWDPIDEESVRGTFRGYLVRVWNHGLSQVYAIPPDVTKTPVQFFPYSRNFITVAVRNDRYVGPRSVAISFDAPQTEPNMPFLFERYQLGASSVLLRWNKPTQPNGILLGYNIYCSEMNGAMVNEKTTINYFVKALEIELEPHTSQPPSMPTFKYKIDYNSTDYDDLIKAKCSETNQYPNIPRPRTEDLVDDFYILNEQEKGKIVTPSPSPNQWVQTNISCLVNTLIKWIPDIDNNPGDHFYVKYRIRGESEFSKTSPQLEEDYLILENFNACVNYEIILVAVDGEYETEIAMKQLTLVSYLIEAGALLTIAGVGREVVTESGHPNSGASSLPSAH